MCDSTIKKDISVILFYLKKKTNMNYVYDLRDFHKRILNNSTILGFV